MGAAESKARAKHPSRLADRPSAPGKPQLVPSDKHSPEPDVVTIRWEPPLYDGGSPVTGYLVEHRRTGSPHWVRSSPTLARLPELTLSGLEPGWRYQFRVSAQNTAGLSEPGELSDLLTVTLQRTVASAPFFVRDLKDTVALENEKAELTVTVRGTPAPTVSWFKDGVELFSSRSYRVVTDNETSTLVIHQAALSDEGEIKCSATNRVGYAFTRCKLSIEAPPSIRLPRQYEEGLLFEKDEVIRLKVSVAGRPVPEVTWQLNGEPVASGKGSRFELAHSERYATLRVGEARRSDRGEYQVRAVNKLGEDTASFLVTVADRPMAPGRAKVVMTLGRSVTLSWAAPEDDGGCKIGNYIVEYYRLGWNMWLKAATCRQLTTTLGDLIEGSEYKFRVKAENPYGVSDPSSDSDVVFIPDPKRGILHPPEHGPIDSEASMDQWLEDKKRAISASPTFDQQYGERKTKKKRGPPSSPQLAPASGGRTDKHSFLSEDSMSPPPTPEDFPPEIPKRRGKLTRLQEEKENVKLDKRENKELFEKKDLKKRRHEDRDIERDLQEERELTIILDERRKVEEFKRFERRKAEEIKRTEEFKKSEELKKIEELKKAEGIMKADELKRKEEIIKEQVKKKSKESVIPQSPMSPRVKGDHMHGSSELMLVLLPHSRATTEERETSKRELFESSMALEGDVAPPMSLSAPELGSGEPLELPAVRSAFSSTELLHERAMARFYQDMAQEEVESMRRRNSLQRRRSFGSRNRVTGSLQDIRPVNDRAEKPSMPETITEEDKPSTSSRVEQSLLKVNIDNKTFSRDSIDSMMSVEDPHRKPPLVQQPSEEDREYEDSSFDEDEEDEYDEEEESVADEGAEEEMEEEIDEDEFSADEKRESFYTSESDDDSRYSYTLDERPYQPIHRKINYNEDTLISAYEKRGPLILGTVTKDTGPPPIPKHEPAETQPNTSNNEVKIKPILKRPPMDSNEGIVDKKSKPLEVDHRLTSLVEGKAVAGSEKRFEPNFTAAMPKPILKVRESSQENLRSVSPSKGSSLTTPEPELGLFSSSKASNDEGSDYDTGVKKKQVRIEEPSDIMARLPSERIDDGAMKQDQERERSGSLGDDADMTRVLINHYSDIVKEYGRMKKPPKPLYLNYEALKAAAEKEERNILQIPEIFVDKPTPDIRTDKEEPDISAVSKELDTHSGNTKTQEFDIVKSSEKNILSSKSNTAREQPRREKHLPPKKSKKRSPSPVIRPPPVVENPTEIDMLKHFENITRTPSPELPPRPITPTERKVHSYFDFLMDISLFFLACWLYVFKDERLSIPILFLMIYRQAHQAFQRKMEALRNKLPRRFLFWRRQ